MSSKDIGVFPSYTIRHDCFYYLIGKDGKFASGFIYPYYFKNKLEKAIKEAQDKKSSKASIYNESFRYGFYVLLVLLICGSIVFWVIRNRQKKIRKELEIRNKINELETKALRSQMNPHFIFNVLNSIQSLLNDNQSAKANEYLIRFGSLLRYVLKNSENTSVPLNLELESLEDYMKLENLRFPFTYKVDVSGPLDIYNSEIPSMVLQPLVENAIKHGVSALGEDGKIDIKIFLKNNLMYVSITDNGKGLSGKTDKQPGYGLKLIHERLDILNRKIPGYQLTVENGITDGNEILGCKTELTIPIEN